MRRGLLAKLYAEIESRLGGSFRVRDPWNESAVLQFETVPAEIVRLSIP